MRAVRLQKFKMLAAIVRSIVSLCVLAFATAVWGAASFQGLGVLPGDNSSQGFAISADGRVIVGDSWGLETSQRPFTWTTEQGMRAVKVNAAGFPELRNARAVSGNALAVVGSGVYDPGAEYPFHEALGFYRSEADGQWHTAAPMGALPGSSPGPFGDSTAATGVSADGAIVVGRSSISLGFKSTAAFRWTSVGGMVSLGDLPGGAFYSEATGVSADGATIVGASHSSSGYEAFRWTEQAGMVGLGDLPGGDFFSFANGVSGDGSVAVGYSYSRHIHLPEGYYTIDREAFRWTASSGMVGLGTILGEQDSEAFAASEDGNVIVGDSGTGAARKAFVWDAANGMRSIQDLLVAGGVNVTGWTLDHARGVSSDGRFIVGTGHNSIANREEAWLVDLGAIATPSTADFDANGVVNGQDLQIWKDHFGGPSASTSTGDANADGRVDGVDFLIWQRQFIGGTVVASQSSVPEPSKSLLLFQAAAVVLGLWSLGRRGRRGEKSHVTTRLSRRFDVFVRVGLSHDAWQ